LENPFAETRRPLQIGRVPPKRAMRHKFELSVINDLKIVTASTHFMIKLGSQSEISGKNRKINRQMYMPTIKG
jgi:hypothetical protein